jgi:hypothetical protein
MRSIISFAAFALILSLSPAAAMCGGGQQAQAGATGQSGMCARPAQSTQADDPFEMKSTKPQQQTTGMGMCPCCRNMASMKMDGDDPHKGMDMTPKQQ